jgi:DNA-binding transcriptional LysR family regulator
MIAVRVTDELSLVVAGSPAYFAQRGKLKSPKDLVAHELHPYRICERRLRAMAFSGQTPRFGSSRRGTIGS